VQGTEDVVVKLGDVMGTLWKERRGEMGGAARIQENSQKPAQKTSEDDSLSV